METNPRRQPSGTPVGGQFASQLHAESAVALHQPTTAQVGEYYKQVSASAEHWSRHRGVDADELKTRVLEQVRLSDPNKYTSGAWVHSTVRYIAAKMASGNENGADFQADCEFRRGVADWEQAHGRQMPTHEKDKLAESIRRSQPPRKRGRVGFHKSRVRMTYLDPTDEASAVFVDPHHHVDGADAAITSVDFDHLDADSLTALVAQEGPWAGLVSMRGAPKANPASITEATAAKIRRQVKELGGARSVATAYLNGEIDEGGAEVLFVPFGGSELNVRDRDQVAMTLAELCGGEPGRAPADVAFNDAIRRATRTKSRSPRVWGKSAKAAGE